MSKKMMKFVDGNMIEYEIYKLVDSYDPILRKPTTPIDFEKIPGKDIAYMAVSLAETCNYYGGLGLSANQVGLPYSICVVNMLSENTIWIMINPVIVDRSVIKSKFKEGCLSFPGLYLEIGRPEKITVEFQAVNGEKLTKEFSGITSTCIQHEVDHLNGICYTDLVSPIKLDMAKRKIKSNLRKIKKLTAA